MNDRLLEQSRTAAKDAFKKAMDAASKAASFCQNLAEADPTNATKWLDAKKAWSNAAQAQYRNWSEM